MLIINQLNKIWVQRINFFYTVVCFLKARVFILYLVTFQAFQDE